MKRFFNIFLVLCLVATTFYGCSKDTKGKNLLYPIDGNVDSLDPQIADSVDELTIIDNTIEGLVRLIDGKVVNGVATDYNISDDGLVYTFNIRKGVKWDLNSNIQKMMGKDFNPDVTADDFVFALRRACSPITNAPYFQTISSINNASEIHKGELDVSSLGVVALDKYTLQITLSKPDDDFLQALCAPIAMPCNQEFFESTKGRYGLEKDFTLFNGPFYLSKWYADSFIIRSSEIYKGENVAVPAKVTLKIPSDKTKVVDNLKEGLFDAALISGSDLKKIDKKDNITIKRYENTSMNFLFNCGDQLFGNANIRKAFFKSFKPYVSDENSYVSPANGIIPDVSMVGNKSYRKAVGDLIFTPNNKSAADSWLAGLKELETTNADITVLCTEEYQPFVKQAIQGVQKAIGMKVTYKKLNGREVSIALSIKIETLTQDELLKRVGKKDYQIALVPVVASDNGYTALKQLAEYNDNVITFDNSVVNKKLSQWNSQTEIDAMIAKAYECEQSFVDNYTVYPYLSVANIYAFGNGVKGIYFNDKDGRVSFIHGEIPS